MRARDFALARLARRAHSEGELSLKMTHAGYEAGDIAETLVYLRERRYVDDATFARDFARVRRERRRWAPARIEAGLRALRVSERHIEEALAENFPDGERATAQLALGRFVETDRRRLSPEHRKARAYRHLLSRGFSQDVVDELVTEQDFEDTDGLIL